MHQIFVVLLYQPIFNIFVGLYHLIPDVGIVIVLLTVFIKLILYPLTAKSIAAQQSLSAIQPKLDELKKQYKDDQQKFAQESMKLYKEHKVNPVGSCIPLLIQFPIFIALFYVLRDGFQQNDFHLLYPFIPNPGEIHTTTLGLLDLRTPSIVLAILAGAAQFWYAKTLSRKRPPAVAGAGAKDENMMAMMNKQMLYVMPVMTIIIGMRFPGGLALYWFVSTLLTALQQAVMVKKNETKEAVKAYIE